MQNNFDPIYIALTNLLLGCSIAVAGTATLGSPVVTGIADTSNLSPGLAVLGSAAPLGDYIQSVDSASQITLSLPLTVSGPVALTAGFFQATTDQARLLRHWDDVGQSGQPALFVTQTGETATKRIGQPTQWVLEAMVWVYVMAPDSNTPSAPALNSLIGLIRSVLSKDATGPGSVQNRQTLGGLVLDTWIDGKINTDNGFLGQQAVAKIPVKMIQNGP